MNRTRVTTGFFLAVAALCLGVDWLMWSTDYIQKASQGSDEDGMLLPVRVFMTPALLVWAGFLVRAAIRRLRRSSQRSPVSASSQPGIYSFHDLMSFAGL